MLFRSVSVKGVTASASYRPNFLCRWCAGGCSPCPPGSAPAPGGRAPVWSGCSSGVWGSKTRSRRWYSPWCTQVLVVVQTQNCYLQPSPGRAVSVTTREKKRGGNADSQTWCKLQTPVSVSVTRPSPESTVRLAGQVQSFKRLIKRQGGLINQKSSPTSPSKRPGEGR